MTVGLSFAQKPYRVGTTAADFLSIGYGSAGIAMGDAQVSMVEDISGIYWNPAGMAFMKKNEAQFIYQPWIADINTAMVGVGVVLPDIGTLSLGAVSANYGDIPVTNMDAQEGTGELYHASEYAFSLSYSRLLTEWFAFGSSIKYINSNIWHTSANAVALDLGVIVNTFFFSPTKNRADGMKIGMSIANYGTRMQYNGLDIVYPIDPIPSEHGNYSDVPGQYRMSSWELPLIFRIGVSLNAVKTEQHRITVELDALHPNNSAEYINLGAEYALTLPSTGIFYLRTGYKALGLPDSQYGMTFGVGFTKYLMNNISLKVGYAFRNIGVLGASNSYSMSIVF